VGPDYTRNDNGDNGPGLKQKIPAGAGIFIGMII